MTTTTTTKLAKITLTALEAKVLFNLYESAVGNGHDFGFTEDHGLADRKSAGGVVASLQKKGLFTIHDPVNGYHQFTWAEESDPEAASAARYPAGLVAARRLLAEAGTPVCWNESMPYVPVPAPTSSWHYDKCAKHGSTSCGCRPPVAHDGEFENCPECASFKAYRKAQQAKKAQPAPAPAPAPQHSIHDGSKADCPTCRAVASANAAEKASGWKPGPSKADEISTLKNLPKGLAAAGFTYLPKLLGPILEAFGGQIEQAIRDDHFVLPRGPVEEQIKTARSTLAALEDEASRVNEVVKTAATRAMKLATEISEAEERLARARRALADLKAALNPNHPL